MRINAVSNQKGGDDMLTTRREFIARVVWATGAVGIIVAAPSAP